MKKIILIFFLTLLLFPKIVFGKNLIRDAEIEETLRIITAPLLENTKINKENFKVLVVNDSSMNAFVTSGQYIFIHYGLITKLETVEQLQSVIAHEIAHIIGGHYIKRMADIESAQTVAGIGMALSAAAGLAAGDTNLVIGLAAGTQSASRRAFLKNTRTQEASADQTGIKLMADANINPNAALEVLEIFKGQEFLTAKRQDPYIQTHPLNTQRISSINKSLESLSYKIKPKDKNLDYLFVFHATDENKEFIIDKVKNTNLDNIDIISDENIKDQVLSNSIFAVSKSGTISLQISSANIPSIIIYKLSFINFMIFKLLVKVKFANIINIINDKEIIPELLQKECNAEEICRTVIYFLKNPELIKKQLDECGKTLEGIKSKTSSFMPSIV